jgi:hypothetical protein
MPTPASATRRYPTSLSTVHGWRPPPQESPASVVGCHAGRSCPLQRTSGQPRVAGPTGAKTTPEGRPTRRCQLTGVRSPPMIPADTPSTRPITALQILPVLLRRVHGLRPGVSAWRSPGGPSSRLPGASLSDRVPPCTAGFTIRTTPLATSRTYSRNPETGRALRPAPKLTTHATSNRGSNAGSR